MTSTPFSVGLSDESRVSSRVLRPPGGGHTDIFGSEPEPQRLGRRPGPNTAVAPTPVKVEEAAKTTNGANGAHGASQVSVNGGGASPQEAPPKAPASSPAEAPNEAPKQAPKEASNEAAKQAPKEAPKQAPKEATKQAPKEAPKPEPAKAEPPKRVRVPPGGFSSGLW